MVIVKMCIPIVKKQKVLVVIIVSVVGGFPLKEISYFLQYTVVISLDVDQGLFFLLIFCIFQVFTIKTFIL